jgi:superfamily II DNA or RNA helicase
MSLKTTSKATKNVSYLLETDSNINNDLVNRKEFVLFKKSVDDTRFKSLLDEENEAKNIIPKFLISDNIPSSNYLELKSYQLLTRNYFNPNTTYSRLLVKWETGSGKTVVALSIALNFIKYYRIQEHDLTDKIGSVYIVGFTQSIFKDELLKYPEFGFISREELEKLKLMKRKSFDGGVADIANLRNYLMMLKKRLYSRKGNGFFKFIGYKELANNLFILNDTSSAEDRNQLSNMTEEEIREHIKNDTIKINKTLLKEFANSLLICDEIHNVYNTYEKNNWGVALQTILNYNDSTRALFLSATPLNNSPTEIIDLLNLLLPRKFYKTLVKSDYFDNANTMKKQKLTEIADYLKGRVSFIRDRNPAFMASKKFTGESITDIDYLKFIRCPMTPLHYNTYKNELKDDLDDDNYIYDDATLGIDSQYLIDFVALDPTLKNPSLAGAMGIYKPKDLALKYGMASNAWENKHHISFDKTKNIITGTILQMDTLPIISNKYATMVLNLLENIKKGKGKTFIYHNNIHMSGVLFIEEILLQNNIINEFGNSNDNTLCAVCGRERKHHSVDEINPLLSDDSDKLNKSSKLGFHVYYPVRFAIVHSNLDKVQINKSLEKFNHVNNIDGSKIMVIIGSKIMKESHSMNSVRNIDIMAKPDNISMLVQIIGRALRLGSHLLLPVEDRSVDISIYVSSIPKKNNLSLEELRYKRKVDTFKVIQELEKLMHENAIDAYFNYDIVFEGDIKDYGLNILPYDKPFKTLKQTELNLSTFNTYYAKNEVEYITYIIKRLFIETSPVWTYNDLFSASKTPPFNTEINSKVISRDLFNIALNNILYNNSAIYEEPDIHTMVDELDASNLMDKLRDPNDKIIIIIKGIDHVIIHTGELYSLVPMNMSEPIVDTETIFRQVSHNVTKKINILQYLKSDNSNNYINKKIRFINKWRFTNLIDLEQCLCDFGTKFHILLLEDIIEYMFNVWTNKNQTKDENHTFYLKMLYFYDVHNLVIFAHMIDNNLKPKYSKYITSESANTGNAAKNTGNAAKNTGNAANTGDINLLTIALTRSDKEWTSTGMIKEFHDHIHESETLFNNIYKKKVVPKVRADLLPVGHYLDKTIRMYDPVDKWYNYISKITKDIPENDIIIGYDKKTRTGMSSRFKLRNPIHKLKQESDIRMLERGFVCSSKSKNELRSIAKKLGIELDNTTLSTDDLCYIIRNRLIYLELKERKKGKNQIRYFYTVLDKHNFDI